MIESFSSNDVSQGFCTGQTPLENKKDEQVKPPFPAGNSALHVSPDAVDLTRNPKDFSVHLSRQGQMQTVAPLVSMNTPGGSTVNGEYVERGPGLGASQAGAASTGVGGFGHAGALTSRFQRFCEDTKKRGPGLCDEEVISSAYAKEKLGIANDHTKDFLEAFRNGHSVGDSMTIASTRKRVRDGLLNPYDRYYLSFIDEGRSALEAETIVAGRRRIADRTATPYDIDFEDLVSHGQSTLAAIQISEARERFWLGTATLIDIYFLNAIEEGHPVEDALANATREAKHHTDTATPADKA